jgi:hypothetical protein
MKSHVFGLALLSAIAVGAGAPAQAQSGSLTRSFVSSSGADSNACTIAAPCASFAQAYAQVGANGIVAALDPGKYGPLTVTGPVTINGNGWAAITVPAQGPGITVAGITVNVGSSDNVTLTGLEIDGAGAGGNGILFNSGGNLVVRNCVLNGSGILIAPASGTIAFTIVDTIVSNGANGIFYFPPSGSATATGVIDHVVVTGNRNGIDADTSFFPSGGSVAISISNSFINNNTTADRTGFGVVTSPGLASIAMTLDNDEISGNDNGIFNGNTNEGVSTMVLGRSTITNNLGADIGNNENIGSLSTIDTFQNNQTQINHTDFGGISGTLTPVQPQ